MGSQELDAFSSSQQTRLSGFFRNVHSRFSSGLVAKKELAAASEAAPSRKKPLLVIGDFTDDNVVPIPAKKADTPVAEANVGAGTKRKAIESEALLQDVVTKRIDAGTFSTSIIRKEPEETSHRVKRVTWEQDSDWIRELPASESPKEVVQQNRNRVQAPSCDEFPDEIDSGNCSTSGRRLRMDVFLGETWGLPVDLKGDLFCSKLKEVLCKPFDAQESSEMWDLVTRRKPVLKLRQTRGRTMHVPSEDEGLSYLDHHPDMAQRIKVFTHPAEKLALLRAFFFWLQHSCMEGAFKPWAPETKSSAPEGDCVLTDGPDCEVLAVVLALDEKE